MIYASARSGWAIKSMQKEKNGVSDLLDTIVEHIPSPNVNINDDLKMLIS